MRLTRNPKFGRQTTSLLRCRGLLQTELSVLVLKVKASQYSVEAANPQHEHEWQDWKGVKLAAGKIVVPGVVTHKTNILEHPQVVADRILRYAEAVGRENVIASTDCGMGGRIHPSLAWAKLKALSEGAALASERLWGKRAAAGR